MQPYFRLSMPPFVVLLGALLSVQTASADSEEDAAMAEYQRRLNAQVMAQPFQPGDVQRVDAYVKEAMKKDLQPRSNPPSYWQPGYTCDHVRRYRHYSYNDYRDCVYYHRYHGSYWGQPVVVRQAAPQPVVVVEKPAPQPVTVVEQPAPKVVAVEEKPTTVTVRKGGNKTITIDEFDEDALEDYYNALKASVEFLMPFSAFTKEQVNAMEKQHGMKLTAAWSMMISGRLQTSQIELMEWPESARQEGWKVLGKRITKYNKLFNQHRETLLKNNALDESFLSNLKNFELLTEESLMEL